MKTFLRTPLFWTGFTFTALILTFFTFKYFSQTFPIIHLNITMDRSSALDHAQQLAVEYNLGPSDSQQTVTFETDDLVKIFVELEGGGKQGFVNMMQQHLYEPYTWHVRHFKQYEKNEAHLYFTPDGKPYGFAEILSENTPGPNLEAKQARSIAETTASQKWNIPVDEFSLVESSKEVQQSGRADHSFVYERPDKRIGEGYYRLQLTVGGDKLTGVRYSVKVPEAFMLRYQNMRSANETIATTAQMAVILLYFICGCLIALFLLYRKRWLIWNMPFLFAFLIALLNALDLLNKLPLRWMYYNTAIAAKGFLLQYMVSIFTHFLYETAYLFLVFMAAESLTRRAFGNHIQLWKLWAAPVASSLPVLGRTIAGYLLVAFTLAFTALFYVTTTTYFNWWIPSQSLFDPDILATYMPWLTSIATALNAGFTEECLFRAIPLACAVLLGNRFGKKNWWLGGAFILQAIIFGSAHALYATQPAYARLVELLFFSGLMGWIYLRFGLLSAIITHFAYDVFWFALPIFVSTASSALVNKTIVVTIALIPLWIVLRARIKTGTFKPVVDAFYNRTWQPPLLQKITAIKKIIPVTTQLSFARKISLFVAGIAGLIVWIFTTQLSNDALPLQSKRADIIVKAQQALEQRNITLSPPWYTMATVFASYKEHPSDTYQHRFIWQEGGSDMYRSLLGIHLTPPHWNVRFAKFEGDITERAEEYRVFLKENGDLLRFLHELPEDRAGKTLREEQARSIAHQLLRDQYNLDPAKLKEVSAIADKKPNRMDWQFTFADQQIYSLKEGEARITIGIAGDEVVDSYRSIHVPEKWERAEQNKQTFAFIIIQLFSLFIYLLFFIGIFFTIKSWGGGYASGRGLLLYGTLISLLLLFEVTNSLPHYVSGFNTSQPFYDQLFRLLGLSIIGLLIRAAGSALLISFINCYTNKYKLSKNFSTALVGISIGTIAAGLEAGIHKFVPSLEPVWANYTALRTFLPTSSGINNTIMYFINITLLFLLGLVTVQALFNKSVKKTTLASVIVFAMGFVLAGLQYADNFTLFLLLGTALGIFFFLTYYFILRFDHALIPLAVGSYTILKLTQQGIFNAHPFAIPIAIGSSVVVVLLALEWFRSLNQ